MPSLRQNVSRTIPGSARWSFTLIKKLALLAFPAAFAFAFTPNASVADGKTVYADSCAKCHGDDGKGATKMGQTRRTRLH